MFSQSDIDTLRLMCWCQFVRPEVLNSISKPVEQDNLLCLGLIQYHEKSGAFTLTRKGRSFLQKIISFIPKLVCLWIKQDRNYKPSNRIIATI